MARSAVANRYNPDIVVGSIASRYKIIENLGEQSQSEATVDDRNNILARRFANPSRRDLLKSAGLVGIAASGVSFSNCSRDEGPEEPEPFQGVVDIHQHVDYQGRLDDQLIAHQEVMGIAQTVLLPAGSVVSRPSTHDGESNGLAAGAGGNEACLRIVEAEPERYAFFVNEVPDLPSAQAELETYLNRGAIGIGEQKFGVDCDSTHIELIAYIAREFDVPVLMHFQHERYNMHIERFHTMLEKFPTVNFIGHAQTWWGNIDQNHEQAVMYAEGPVTPGGISDRYLSDYPNMFGDLSANSGRNSLARDEDHAREFLKRHQDKLLFGSDCTDTFGQGDECIGANTLSILRRLVEDEAALEKILGRNARRIMRL